MLNSCLSHLSSQKTGMRCIFPRQEMGGFDKNETKWPQLKQLWAFPGSSAGKESTCKCRRPWFDFWVGTIPWRRDRLPTPVFLGFPGSSDSKESDCNTREWGSIPGLGSSPGDRNSYPLQYSCLENSMGRGAWRAAVHGVTKKQNN